MFGLLFISTDSYVDYMSQVASAAPKTPFYLYDIDFFTGVKCEYQQRLCTICQLKKSLTFFLI